MMSALTEGGRKRQNSGQSKGGCVTYTGFHHKSIPRFDKFCSCGCSLFLSQLASSILTTWEQPYSQALYRHSNQLSIGAMGKFCECLKWMAPILSSDNWPAVHVAYVSVSGCDAIGNLFSLIPTSPSPKHSEGYPQDRYHQCCPDTAFAKEKSFDTHILNVRYLYTS